MRIAVMHYHLKPGGVTTVIRQQTGTAGPDNDFLVIVGEAPPEKTAAPGKPTTPNEPDRTGRLDIVCLPEIGYDTPAGPACKDPAAAATRISAAIRDKWPGGCDLLHVHNPFLAKNRSFLKILNILKARGEPLFLQIHDLAEDGRPGSYFADDPYPADCHFGVINSRDRDVLIKAGARAQGVHMLGNAVTPLPVASNRPGTKTGSQGHVLYPVRAIRRKNIGEAILLSLFFDNETQLTITLGPNSPADIAAYKGWQTFAKENRLNVCFEASAQRPFAELVTTASSMLTTSVSEGFGFSFLEPWTAGKPLFGRRIPRICDDFEQQGVRLDHLYQTLAVPTAWVGPEALAKKIQAAISSSARAFRAAFKPAQAQALIDLAAQGHVDFGLLDEALQKKVIRRILSDGNGKTQMETLNPFLTTLTRTDRTADADKERIKTNRAAVEAHFNDRACGDRLTVAYRAASKHKVSHRLDKSVMLDAFFTPETFTLLKWEDYDDS